MISLISPATRKYFQHHTLCVYRALRWNWLAKCSRTLEILIDHHVIVYHVIKVTSAEKWCFTDFSSHVEVWTLRHASILLLFFVQQVNCSPFQVLFRRPVAAQLVLTSFNVTDTVIFSWSSRIRPTVLIRTSPSTTTRWRSDAPRQRQHDH